MTNAQTGRSGIDESLIGTVKVTIEARLGQAVLTVDELSALKSGSLVTLDTGLADHVDLFLNGHLVARGEIVAIGDNFGIRIADISKE